MGGEADIKVLFKNRRKASILDPTYIPVGGTCNVGCLFVLCSNTCLEKDKKKLKDLFNQFEIFQLEM